MKKKAYVVFPTLFVLCCLCLFLFSLLLGKITVFAKIYLPVGASSVIGLVPGVLMIVSVASLVLTFVFSRRASVIAAAAAAAVITAFFAFVFPVLGSVCDRNYISHLDSRVDFINGYLSGEEELFAYDVGSFKVDGSVSSSNSVKMGKIGGDDVFVFRVNYGFFARYAMYVNGTADPEDELIPVFGQTPTRSFRVIKEYGNGWYLVRDS